MFPDSANDPIFDVCQSWISVPPRKAHKIGTRNRSDRVAWPHLLNEIGEIRRTRWELIERDDLGDTRRVRPVIQFWHHILTVDAPRTEQFDKKGASAEIDVLYTLEFDARKADTRFEI